MNATIELIGSPLAVGDRVVDRRNEKVGVILAIHDNAAWVKIDSATLRGKFTFNLSDLSREVTE